MAGYSYLSVVDADQAVFNILTGDIVIRTHNGIEHTSSTAIDTNGSNGLLLLYQLREAIEQAFKHHLSK